MKYKILYFLDYGKGFGGAANTLLQQAILMRKAGHKVTIFMSDYYGTDIEKDYQEICNANQITFNWLTYQICSHTEDIDIICLLQNYESAKEIVKRYNPDILHSVQINPLVELVGRDLKIPHIMNVYPLIPAFFSLKYLDIFPHYHICDSVYYAKKWNYYMDTEYTCIRTVVNTNTKPKMYFSKDKEIRFICVGSVYKQKNQLSVIKAFHKALLKGVTGSLSIYGHKQDEYGQLCQRYIDENNLQEYIFMKGFYSDMQSQYKKANVLVCGSTRESYPNVISEAMSNGLIIISTPVGGVPEIIKDGVNGYLCENYSVEELYHKMIQVYKDRNSDKINQILLNSYNTFQKEHSPNTITKKLNEYYLHVCKSYQYVEKISFGDLKNKFTDIISFYEEKKMFFSRKLFVESKLWYIYHIKKIIEKKSDNPCLKYYIWGTGKYAKYVKEIIDIFFPYINISGFLDTYVCGKYMEKDIFFPEEIIKDVNSIIFIGAVNGQLEMIEQLEKNNKCCNKEYFIIAPRIW